MIFRTILAACAIAALSSHAYGFDWQDDYRGYQQALEAGDTAAAADYAERAWQGARDALPPGENRALLAQNFIMAVYPSDAARAEEAMREAVALAEQGYGTSNLSEPTVRFLLEAYEASDQPRNRRATEAAYRTYKDVPTESLTLPEVIRARMYLMQGLMRHERYSETHEVADGLATDIRLGGGSTSALAFAEAFRAMAIASDRPSYATDKSSTRSRIQDQGVGNYLDNVRQAIRENRKAQKIFPMQTSIESFDASLGQIAAYEMFLRAVAYSYMQSYETEAFDQSVGPGVAIIRREQRCPSIDWENNEMRFPSSESGYNGAVLYGFDLDKSGRTENVRVIAAVPDDRFAAPTEEALSRWKANVGRMNEACRSNHTGSYLFYTQANR